MIFDQESSTAAFKARRRAGYAGVSKLRKTLRRMDDEITEGLKKELADGADDIYWTSIANLQSQLGEYSYGELVQSVKAHENRDGLTWYIGPGADRVKPTKSPFNTTKYKTAPDKEAAFNFFKGYWFEFGTKGYPERNIPAQRARPWLNPAYDVHAPKIKRGVKKELALAIRRAAQGG